MLCKISTHFCGKIKAKPVWLGRIIKFKWHISYIYHIYIAFVHVHCSYQCIYQDIWRCSCNDRSISFLIIKVMNEFWKVARLITSDVIYVYQQSKYLAKTNECLILIFIISIFIIYDNLKKKYIFFRKDWTWSLDKWGKLLERCNNQNLYSIPRMASVSSLYIIRQNLLIEFFWITGAGHRTALIASSKTVLRPFWVRAEHSRYLTAPTSLAMANPCNQKY